MTDLAVFYCTIQIIYVYKKQERSQIEPCGTPQQITRESVGWIIINTYKFSFFKDMKKASYCCTFYITPQQFNIWTSISWSIGWNHFSKLSNISQPKVPLTICSFILFVSWIIACEVHCFCKNPNSRLDMRYFESKNSYRQLDMNLSGTLSIIISKNIEQRFGNFSLDPTLKMEMILLDFRIEGETPNEKEKS